MRIWIRKAAQPTLLLVALGGLLQLAGCATPVAEVSPEDPFRLPPAAVIGTVVLVDPEEQLALVQLHATATRLAPVMTTRNDALVETAQLQPTRFQRGHTLGARILSGLPNVGDEVVAAQR